MIAWDEIMYVMDIVSTNMTNTIPTNITNIMSTNVSTNSDGKKVKDKVNVLRTVLLVIILLFIIAIICYHYAKHRSKLKNRIAELKI